MNKLPLDVSYRGLSQRLSELRDIDTGYYMVIHKLERVLDTLKALRVDPTHTYKLRGLCSVCEEVTDNWASANEMIHILRQHFNQISYDNGRLASPLGYWWTTDGSNVEQLTTENWYDPRIKFVKMLINFYKRKVNEKFRP